MKGRTIFLILVAIGPLVASGCAHRTTQHPEPRLESFLATLRVGMTSKAAEPDLVRFGGIPFSGSGFSMRHQKAYGFPDGGVVTVQFDENDRLVSWERWQEGKR